MAYRLSESMLWATIASRMLLETATMFVGSVGLIWSWWSIKWVPRSYHTYVKVAENPIDIPLPGRDPAYIPPSVENPRKGTPFVLLVERPLNLCNNSTTKNLVRTSPGARITSSAHVESCSISPSTDPLRPSNPLPSKLRSRTLQASVQDCLSSA